MSRFDAVIIGGGPAGLAAALALGRARRRVLVCDAGSPRNAAAKHIHNFVTRDGTEPAEFRRIGRAQLRQYGSVEVRDTWVNTVEGERDAFRVRTADGTVQARRVILCTGMVDEPVDIPGFRAAWGHSIFQCPYCHGWEVKEKRWGFLALNLEGLQHGFPSLLRSWTPDVAVFRAAELEIPADLRPGRYEDSPVKQLIVDGTSVTHVELADGTRHPCDILYAHPPQRQVDVIERLDLGLDDHGFVQADPMTRQTSTPGIYAAGDLSTFAQGAIFAAAAGTQAGAMVNHDLAMSAAEKSVQE